MGRFLYIVCDWAKPTINAVSYKRDKVYAKVGEDYLKGVNVENYRVMEIDLEQESLLQEMKEVGVNGGNEEYE